MIKQLSRIFIILVLSSSLSAKFDASRFSAGLYTEYPVSNGLSINYKLKSDYFFQAKYGIASEFYMDQMGDILSNFDWWRPIYSDLLTELLTGMQGATIGFGKDNVFGKEGVFILVGTSFYKLAYDERSNDAFNDVFGTTLPDGGRDLIINGKLVALSFSIGKRFIVKEKWDIDTIIGVSRIASVYAIAESDFFANNTLSYKLSKWLRDNLEGLILPTATIAVRRRF